MFSFLRRKRGKHGVRRDRPHTETSTPEKHADSVAVSDIPPPLTGPHDSNEAPDDVVPHADFGSLRIPHAEGLQFHVETTENGEPSQNLSGVMVTDGSSSGLHLSVYAAPRSESLWDEICAEAQSEFRNNGSTVYQSEGEFGPELHTTLDTPQGPRDVRFIGVDGPRWLLRCVFSGAAAKPEAPEAKMLTDVLRGVVVVRGDDPRPVREPLPLRLPEGTQPLR